MDKESKTLIWVGTIIAVLLGLGMFMTFVLLIVNESSAVTVDERQQYIEGCYYDAISEYDLSIEEVVELGEIYELTSTGMHIIDINEYLDLSVNTLMAYSDSILCVALLDGENGVI